MGLREVPEDLSGASGGLKGVPGDFGGFTGISVGLRGSRWSYEVLGVFNGTSKAFHSFRSLLKLPQSL